MSCAAHSAATGPHSLFLVGWSYSRYDGLGAVPRDPSKPEIPDALLKELKENLVTRHVSSGFAVLDTNQRLLAAIDPAQPNAAALVGHVAQWVDIGYGEPELVERLLARFPKEMRSRLPVGDYLQLRMAEGLLALLHDHPDEALRHFDLVLSLRDEIEDKEVVAIAHFWNGRCHRKKGEYDEALKRSGAGRELAQSLGYEKMAAVMRVLESWLHFQKGQHREAVRILDQAESVLRSTDDDITLGNIYSAHGRMVRRQGSYSEALKFFSRAIEHFHHALRLAHGFVAEFDVVPGPVTEQRLCGQRCAGTRRQDRDASDRRQRSTCVSRLPETSHATIPSLTTLPSMTTTHHDGQSLRMPDICRNSRRVRMHRAVPGCCRSLR